MIAAIGWILDRIFGDPIWLPHPIVLFGKLIHIGDKWFNKNKYKTLKGGIMAMILIATTFITTYLLLKLCLNINIWLYYTACIIGVFFCLAGKTLSKEVKMVFQATDRSIEEGRQQVSRIVGRDTSNLTSQQVHTAALETLAENLSDGVIAPLFWFIIAGVPGMFAYKMINTLDSMIGYKNSKYLEFGKIAAKTDDIANYIPARLTAILMLLSHPKNFTNNFRFVLRYGTKHASPNSGYPEAALASILNCRFGGTHNYFGNAVYKPYIGINYKEFTNKDMKIALGVNFKAEILMVLITTIITFLYCNIYNISIFFR